MAIVLLFLIKNSRAIAYLVAIASFSRIEIIAIAPISARIYIKAIAIDFLDKGQTPQLVNALISC
ncbi:MAG: hypothetical protein AB4290_01690 [Spirulina sp.]